MKISKVRRTRLYVLMSIFIVVSALSLATLFANSDSKIGRVLIPDFLVKDSEESNIANNFTDAEEIINVDTETVDDNIPSVVSNSTDEEINNKLTLTREELLERGGPNLENGYVPSEQDIQANSFFITPSASFVELNQSGIASITLSGDNNKTIDSITYSGYDTSALRPIESYSSSYCSISNPCEIRFVHVNSPEPVNTSGSTKVLITGYNASRNIYSTISVNVIW